MALSDLQVFQEETYTNMTETLNQNVALFNQATNGGLVMATAAHQGDFSTESFWKAVSGLVRERDPYADTAIGEKQLTMGAKTSVKYASGTPVLRMDAAWMKWIQRDPVEAGVVFGRQLAEQRMQDQLHVALRAFIAAISGQATNVYDHTGQTENAGKACLEAMLRAQAKFGDQSSRIMCWVMHSKSVNDTYEQQLKNDNRLFDFGGIVVMRDVQGRPIIQTDAPPLYSNNATPGDPADDYYWLCGLTGAAVLLEGNSDFNQTTQELTGNENIRTVYQAEWSEQLGVKGFTWDVVNGGKNPTRAEMGTTTNWDKVMTDPKDLAGVLAKVK